MFCSIFEKKKKNRTQHKNLQTREFSKKLFCTITKWCLFWFCEIEIQMQEEKFC